MAGSSDRPLRTLHLCTTTDRRGAEVSTIDLVAALGDRGLASRAIALREGTSTDRINIPFLGKRGRTPVAIARLRREVLNSDVVVAHGAATLLATYLATRGTGVPFVYRMIGDPRFWGDVKLKTLRISAPLRAAKHVVALWDDAAVGVQELHGVHPDRTTVIVNGRDHRRFRPPTSAERQEAKDHFGLSADVPVVGFLGALSWEKNPILALRIASDMPTIHLAVAGDGPLRDSIGSETGANVSLLGAIKDPQRFLWATDVLLLTSRTEGLPGVVIEAGLCGIPSVAPDVGGTADLVDDQTGCLVARSATAPEYRAAIEHCLLERENLGAAALEQCGDGFTAGHAADRWISLFQRLGGEEGMRGPVT